MAKANKSRYAVLGILADAPGSSGYDIRSIMKGSTGHFWQETFSSIYPVLDVLEKENLITEVEGSLSGRKRKSYKITKEGLKTLQNWLMEDVELEQGRNELLLKIFFGQLNSISSSIKHVEDYKNRILAKKHLLEQARIMLPKEYPDDAGLPFWLLSVEFGIRRMQSSIEWCEFALDKLSKIK
ncbi:MAG TPA: PadR family transcriptional regulator [Puia sp.]|jgi:DNA-binding PadR family transcriptional regulator|nr:PadR family transcriptional regulator [Puia sp.]